jgi:ABC-type antimicrobial peptide transport system permease subunit
MVAASFLAFFVGIPILMLVTGFLVTRSAWGAGVALVIVTALLGYANTLFWYALILGLVFGLMFPKQRHAWPNA